ncbi:tryptophan--tRNA ligase [Candidatus Woesearchaeota archaeon]|nr:tryptophan--tRNA ligase [Candidatus Woesearchaeota archaeon]
MAGKDFKVTPWEVSGEVDYDRIIKDFGIQKIDEVLLNRIKKYTKDIHYTLRRKIFFAHRDFNLLLDKYEKGEKFFLYTGRAPSGMVHLGHLVPWMFTKWLQDKFNCDLWFQFPDEEKFLFKEKLTLEDTEKYLKENMLDVIALGFDPKKTKFLIDTLHAKLLYKQAVRVAKKITFSTVKATFGFGGETNIGAIFYTAMQAVPAFLPSVLTGRNIPCLVPLGFDQDPHFRISRDVIVKLGYYNPAIIHCRFMPSLQGPGKMSASIVESGIYTTDDPKTVEMKIKKHAFSGGQPTIEEHRKKGGNPDIDSCYQILNYLEPDDKKVTKIYNDYKSGKLLTGKLKEITIEFINKFLKEHQKKREQARKLVDKYIYKD